MSLYPNNSTDRLKFTSSDTDIAAVTNWGTVKAVSSGNAVITVKAASGVIAKMLHQSLQLKVHSSSLATDSPSINSPLTRQFSIVVVIGDSISLISFLAASIPIFQNFALL